MHDEVVKLSAIKACPKVELAIHFEGALSSLTLERLGEASSDGPDGGQAPGLDATEGASCSGFELIRTRQQAEQAAYQLALALGKQGVLYAEANVTPTLWHPRWQAQVLFGALAEGFAKAADGKGADCYLVPSLLYTDDALHAYELVGWMTSQKPSRVAGLGLWGAAPGGHRPQAFAAPFEAARAAGYGLSARLGSAGGTDFLKEILEFLRPHRIECADAVIKDKQLVQRLANECRPCSICPSASARMGVAPRGQLPAAALIQAGVPVYIGTDMPEWLQTNINDELKQVAQLCGWNLLQLKAAMHRAIDAAFCPEMLRCELTRSIEAWSPGA